MSDKIITISDIAKILDTTSEAVRMRLYRRGIKAFRYIGTTGLYREGDIELIREAPRGRHKATPSKTRQPATKPKTKKS
jgi:hypothetical protein